MQGLWRMVVKWLAWWCAQPVVQRLHAFCHYGGFCHLIFSAGRLCAELHDGSQRGHGSFLCHLHFHTRNKSAEVLGQGLVTRAHQQSEILIRFGVMFLTFGTINLLCIRI